MQKIRIALLALLFLVVAVLVAVPVSGQSGFTIENADASNTLSFTSSPELNTLISQVAPRFVVEFANNNRYYALTPIPSGLDNLLAALQPRFVMVYANANKYYALSPIPSQLDSLLGQIAPRFILQYANTNRKLALSFPVDLIDDTAPPQVSNIEIKPAGETNTTITWNTDEYADSSIRCGTQSGNYTLTFSDPLYVKVHTITLSDLTAGTTYYCRISSMDLSGNIYQSSEFSFEQMEEFFIYLPLVLRK